MEEIGLYLLCAVEPSHDDGGAPKALSRSGNVGSPYQGCLFNDSGGAKGVDVKGGLCHPDVDIVMELLPFSISD